MGRIRIQFTVTKALAGQSLDRAIEALTGDVSRSRAQKLVRRGDVTVDGRRVVRSNGKVQAGMRIGLERERPPTEVLFQDGEILVVNKAPGLLTHAADRADGDDDLAAELDRRFGPLPTSRGIERPGIVHRLDRETSGLLVVARTEEALDALQQQFKERAVHKTYMAIVCGVPGEDTLRCDAPLGPVPGTMDRQGVDRERGKPAVTVVEVAARGARHALVHCTIETGRRHQIRVHLAEAGFPVLGDPLYGTKKAVPAPANVPAFERLALHAWRLGFAHPGTGEAMSFEAGPPHDLTRLSEALGLL